MIPGDPHAIDRALQQAQEQYEQQRQALTMRITELELQIITEKQQQESTIIDLQTKLVENDTATAAAKSGLMFAQQQLDAVRAEKDEKEDAIEIYTKQMTALKTQIQQLEKDNKELKVDLQVLHTLNISSKSHPILIFTKSKRYSDSILMLTLTEPNLI